MNVADYEDANVARYGEYPAAQLVGQQVWTSTMLHDRARRLAAALIALGVGPHARVLVAVPSCPELFLISSAIWRAGAVLVLAFAKSPPAEFERIVGHCAPTTVIASTDAMDRVEVATRGFTRRIAVGATAGQAGWLGMDDLIAQHEPLSRPVDREDSDLIEISYSSGTTGIPKAVMYTQGVTRAMLDRLRREGNTEWGTGAVDLAVLPASAGGGQVLKRRLAVKKNVVLVDDLKPEQLLAAMGTYRVTEMMIVPSICELMLGCPNLESYDFSSLRLIILGGAPVSVSLTKRFEAAFGIHPTIRYGMTEGGYGFTETTLASKPGAVGWPLQHVELKVIDDDWNTLPPDTVGRVCAKSPYLASGYYKAPPDEVASFRDGWYRTGDLGYFDTDGELFLVARNKEMIIQSGVNVYPSEVIDIIERIPNVKECAVVGLPDALLGEAVVAFVVRGAGVGPTDDDVLAFCRTQIDPRKSPVRVVFRDTLPRNQMGKLLLADLRTQFLAEEARRRGERAGAASSSASASSTTQLAERIAAAPPAQRNQLLLIVIEAQLARLVPASAGVDSAVTFAERGLGSLGVVQLLHRIGDELGRALPTTLTFRNATPVALAARLVELFDTAPADMLEVVPTHKTTSRATTPQEYFWYLSQADPDPGAYAVQSVQVLEGELDRDVLKQCVETWIAQHEVFRTGFREVDGVLRQVVLPDPPRFELELADRSGVPQPQWPAEIERAVDDLLARGLDLAAGRPLRGMSITFAPDRHALIFILHHAVADAGSMVALRAGILTRLAQLRSGAAPAMTRPLQYIDYAEALERYRETPTGRAQQAWWRGQLRDARPLELPVDHVRAAFDARRAAARFGITPDRQHYPYFQRELDAPLRDRVARVAQQRRTTSYVVYLAALARLFHQLSNNDDICIENTYSVRPHYRALDALQGAIVAWTMLRIDVSGCPTLGDVIDRAREVVGNANENGLIANYYNVVPHTLRRVAFNYVLVESREPPTVPGLHVTNLPRPFPRWKRPWELHLTMIESPAAAKLVWTGAEELFARSTVGALLDRYLDLLHRELA